MEKLNGVIGRARVHHGVVNKISADHTAQRNDAIGHAFGKVEHVGHHTVIVGAEVGAHAAKACDHLVKNKQNAVLVTNFTQALQVTLGRQIPTRRTRNRLDDDGGHIAGIVQSQNTGFQF